MKEINKYGNTLKTGGIISNALYYYRRIVANHNLMYISRYLPKRILSVPSKTTVIV